MKIKKILVSQPAPTVEDKSPYYEISKNHGVTVDYRPFIRVEGVGLKGFRSQRIEILEHTAVIFTSRTTVDHFFRICEEARVNVPETMRYICNTETVALYLQKYIVYRKRKISFADGSFHNFMELIMKYRDEKFLLILSEPHKAEIPETMEKLKLNFNKVILSRTVPADLSDIDRKQYDMFVLFSHPEIKSLVANFGTDELPCVATFGDGTTRAALDAGVTVCVKAPTPEAPSMAKAIDIFVGKINSGKTVDAVTLEDNKRADEFIKAQEAKPVKKSKSRTNGAVGTNGAAKTTTKDTAKTAATAKGAKVIVAAKAAKPAISPAKAK